MTWVEVKRDDYDFCIESENYEVRRNGEQVGLYCYDYRIGWCNNIEEGMFMAWALRLREKRKE